MFKVGNVTPAADRVPDGHYCTTREAQNGVVWLDWDKANEEVKVGLLNKSNHTYTNTHTHREREHHHVFTQKSISKTRLCPVMSPSGLGKVKALGLM